jgi:hypothetical protein
VGGVFFEKTDKTKQNLIEIFDTRFITEIEILSFINSKKRLKKIISCIEKNRNLNLIVKSKKSFFIDNQLLLIDIFHKTRKAMLKRYPIQARLLFIADKINGKRQLKD